jgi:hypothetical protein
MARTIRDTLKSFFQTGDVPTEGQYVDLIDSNLNLSENNTGNIDLTGNITASGNISSSITSEIETGFFSTKGGFITASGHISASGNLSLQGTASIEGSISASGFSASGFTQLQDFRAKIPNSGEILFIAGDHELEIKDLNGVQGYSFGNLDGLGNNDARFQTNGQISATTRVTASSFIASTNITASGNISASGNIRGNSLTLGNTLITATGTEINHIDGLTSAEASQIKNINSTTISSTQWGYVGNMNQNVNTSTAVKFSGLILVETTTNVDASSATSIALGDGRGSYTINFSNLGPIQANAISDYVFALTGDVFDGRTGVTIMGNCNEISDTIVVEPVFTYAGNKGNLRFRAGNEIFSGGSLVVHFTIISHE